MKRKGAAEEGRGQEVKLVPRLRLKPRNNLTAMKIAIKNIKGKDQGELEVKFPLIENGKGTQAVHDAVTAYRAAQRSGTACTKNVGEVAGTNKKAVAAKGHRPRPRRLLPVAVVGGWRRGLRTPAA
jgi:hypothetical protein